MQTRYAIAIKGKTLFYATLEEAEAMAKFCGISTALIRVVDLY